MSKELQRIQARARDSARSGTFIGTVHMIASHEHVTAGYISRLLPVLSENHIRTYWWCSPARVGMAKMAPERWTARYKGASFCNAKCVRA
jgi:hypothetical protein